MTPCRRPGTRGFAPRSRGRAFSALGAALLLFVLAACVAPRSYVVPAGPAAGGTDTFKVGTFNIKNVYPDRKNDSWPERRDVVGRLLHSEDPDIVGFQEVEDDWSEQPLPSSQLAWLKRAFPTHTFVGDGDPELVPTANPIAVRSTRFRVLESGFFSFSRTPDTPHIRDWGSFLPRHCTWARVEEGTTRRRLYIYNVHLDHLSARSRVRSAAFLAQRIRERRHDDPVIVLGDFNATRRSKALRVLLSEADLSHAVERTPTGSFHFFLGVALWPRIDHVLISPGLASRGGYLCYYRDGRYPSDHFPLFAWISVAPADS
jgi:endonuclease/exonuclease/phosphatase family metal-dependent hydrolase